MIQKIKEAITSGITYQEYREMVNQMVVDGRTSGPIQNEEMAHYTKMNAVRMKRLDKTTELLDEALEVVKGISTPQTWLIVTEAWCGDAAQILPVIEKLSEQNQLVSTTYVFRDVPLSSGEFLIDSFLTDGGKGIPQIIVLDEEKNEVIGNFGPRPSVMQAMVMARKKDPNASHYSEFIIEAQKWYAAEKTVSIQKEFVEVLKKVTVLK